MTELVINAPHMQTGTQRLGAISVTVAGWLLWCYFFFPLVTLSGWLLDFEACSRWVNLSGGYLNLREILAVYGATVAGMAGLWGCWAFYNGLKRRRQAISQIKVIGVPELSARFGVDAGTLKRCQQSQYSVVHFDDRGHIVGLEHG